MLKWFNINADWWTLGIFIYEMIAGIDPFNADDPMVMYTNILESKLKFPVNFDRYLMVKKGCEEFGGSFVATGCQ